MNDLILKQEISDLVARLTDITPYVNDVTELVENVIDQYKQKEILKYNSFKLKSNLFMNPLKNKLDREFNFENITKIVKEFFKKFTEMDKITDCFETLSLKALNTNTKTFKELKAKFPKVTRFIVCTNSLKFVIGDWYNFSHKNESICWLFKYFMNEDLEINLDYKMDSLDQWKNVSKSGNIVAIFRKNGTLELKSSIKTDGLERIFKALADKNKYEHNLYLYQGY